MKTLALPAPSRESELDNYRRTREAHLGSALLHASNYKGPRAHDPRLDIDWARAFPKAKTPRSKSPTPPASPTWQLSIHDAPKGSRVWVVGCIWHQGGSTITQTLGMVIAKTAAKAKRMHHELTRSNTPAVQYARPIQTTCWIAGSSYCKTFSI